MAVTPSNVSSAEFTVVQLAGTDDYGTEITGGGLSNWELETFDQYTGGFITPIIKPTQIKQYPRLTFGGFLNSVNDTHLVGMALDVDGTISYVSANTVVPITIGYGRHTTASQGFQTTGCFATRWNITGRANQLIQFTADLVGTATDVATLTHDTTPTIPAFYPWEKMTFKLGTAFGTYTAAATTLIGFSWSLNTGYTPGFYAGGTQAYVNIDEGVKVLDLELRMAHNATSVAEWVKYDAVNPTSIELLLTDTATGTLKLETFGYYLNFRQEKEAGKLVLVGSLRAYYDSTNSNGLAVTLNV